jgi:hypothetical protein
MTRKPAAIPCLVAALLLNAPGCLYRHQSAACRERGAGYEARVEKLRRDAHQRLTIGTKKDAVVRFFTDNSLPVTFIAPEATGIPGEATGTIRITGCAPSGCGSDAAILVLQVEVDTSGTVLSEPRVSATYTDCL